MDHFDQLSGTLRASAKDKPIQLSESFSNLPVQAGEAIADGQVQAMQAAYEKRMAEGTTLFAKSKITARPAELGNATAEIQLEGVRAAVFGFMWRWGLVGGFTSAVCLLFGLGLSVSAIALLLSVPVSLVLVVV